MMYLASLDWTPGLDVYLSDTAGALTHTPTTLSAQKIGYAVTADSIFIDLNGEYELKQMTWSFDPKAVCDGAVDRLFLMTVNNPDGIVVKKWTVSFEADPTTEADLDLKRADAFIGVANAAVMDVLDTTSGASSESTPGNINSGNAVADTKVMYLEFGTAYTETTHQIIFQMWYWEKK